MLFEHDLSVEESRLASQEAEESLRQLCVHTIPDVQRQAPAMFGQLVRHLRQLDSAGLLALHRNVRRGGYCPNAEYVISYVICVKLKFIAKKNEHLLFLNWITKNIRINKC